jgi:hypothetical protein
VIALHAGNMGVKQGLENVVEVAIPDNDRRRFIRRPRRPIRR